MCAITIACATFGGQYPSSWPAIDDNVILGCVDLTGEYTLNGTASKANPQNEYASPPYKINDVLFPSYWFGGKEVTRMTITRTEGEHSRLILWNNDNSIYELELNPKTENIDCYDNSVVLTTINKIGERDKGTQTIETKLQKTIQGDLAINIIDTQSQIRGEIIIPIYIKGESSYWYLFKKL